jgi:hypothetical protein
LKLLSTKAHAEGTAVGFNKRKKGARSYYPLFCTVAQTGQFFDVHHRPGNVHDSNGAADFMMRCFEKARSELANTRFESRIDAAFFNKKICDVFDANKVQFTGSVPFERFAELKEMIEARKRWRIIDRQWSYFEARWKPKAWDTKYRFIFTRRKVKSQYKGPLQLDLFEPRAFNYIRLSLPTKPTQLKVLCCSITAVVRRKPSSARPKTTPVSMLFPLGVWRATRYLPFAR